MILTNSPGPVRETIQIDSRDPLAIGPKERDLIPVNALTVNKSGIFHGSVLKSLAVHKAVHRVGLTEVKRIRHGDVSTVAKKAIFLEIVLKKENSGPIDLREAAMGAARKVTHRGTALSQIKTDRAGIIGTEMTLKMETITGLGAHSLTGMVAVDGMADTIEMARGEMNKVMTSRAGLGLKGGIGLVIATIRVGLTGLKGASSAARKATLLENVKEKVARAIKVGLDHVRTGEGLMVVMPPVMAIGAGGNRAPMEAVLPGAAKQMLDGESTVLLE